MKLPSLVITGLGLATPLGGTVQSTWSALLAGRAIFDHAHVEELEPGDGLRVNRLARQVARQAVAHAQWSPAQTRDAALVVGTSKGPVEGWLAGPAHKIGKTRYVTEGHLGCFGMAQVATMLARELEIAQAQGPVLTLSAACASGLHAIIRAAMMLAAGEASRVLVVAAESSLHPLFIQSFRRLGVLPPPGEVCRPFDQNRRGFLMSEAAAAVCLEIAEADDACEQPIATVERFALGADSTHLTGIDPQTKTLRRLLRDVIDGRPVDFIHAHGTGTIANDGAELSAIESQVPPGSLPPDLYSHKGALGHSLGTAGLVAAVINCLIHQHDIVPPNIRTETPLVTTNVRISRATEHRQVKRSLILAAGFGGPLATVALAAPA